MIPNIVKGWADLLGPSAPQRPVADFQPGMSWLDLLSMFSRGPSYQYERRESPIPDISRLFQSRPAPRTFRPTGRTGLAAPPAPPVVALPQPSMSQSIPTQMPDMGQSPVVQVEISRAPTPELAQWIPMAQQAAIKHNVPIDVVMAVMQIESGGRPKALSNAGAMGLMQVMPFHFNPGENGMDPALNIDRGVSILAREYARYSDWDKAAAAYFGALDRSTGQIVGDAKDTQGTTGNAYLQAFHAARNYYTGGQ